MAMMRLGFTPLMRNSGVSVMASGAALAGGIASIDTSAAAAAVAR